MNSRTAFALVLAACSSKQPARTVRVAAASDLVHAFDELVPAFKAKTGIQPIVDFGASGVLAKRIADGTPYFLFIAANDAFVADVVAAGRCDPGSVRQYARGRLAVWSPPDVERPAKLEDLVEPRFRRIAIADPQRAPYGRAAQQALEQAGVWGPLSERLVIVDDVYSALQAAREHRADAAIVSMSLTSAADRGGFLAIDAALHEPIDQVLVACGTGDEAAAARELAAFIFSPDAQEVWTRYGLVASQRIEEVRRAGAKR
jgi:molybdate transport system substrate-binding protein